MAQLQIAVAMLAVSIAGIAFLLDVGRKQRAD